MLIWRTPNVSSAQFHILWECKEFCVFEMSTFQGMGVSEPEIYPFLLQVLPAVSPSLGVQAAPICSPRVGFSALQFRSSSDKGHQPLLFSHPSLRHHLIPCNLQSDTFSWTVLWLLCPARSCGSVTRARFIFLATCCLSLLPQFLPSFSIIYFLFLYVR